MEDALGVAAEDRRLRVDAELCLADDADRFRIAEPERMVAAEQDAVVADGPREIAERLPEVRRRLPERIVRGVAERPAERVRIDHGAAQAEVSHRDPQLLRGGRGIL